VVVSTALVARSVVVLAALLAVSATVPAVEDATLPAVLAAVEAASDALSVAVLAVCLAVEPSWAAVPEAELRTPPPMLPEPLVAGLEPLMEDIEPPACPPEILPCSSEPAARESPTASRGRLRTCSVTVEVRVVSAPFASGATVSSFRDISALVPAMSACI
jgi:hypothetical protein